jgi:shikimate kinase
MPATIVARISGNDDRPSLTGNQSFTEEVVQVLTRRAPLYAALAHVRLDTDARAPTAIAQQIIELFPGVT